MNEYFVVSPYNVKEVTFQRKYPGYIYRREIIINETYHGGGESERTNCYSSDTGHWIGSPKDARFLCKKKGLRDVQKAHESDCVASIGFNVDEQKWYGWSHRAICGFGIGDKLFEEEYGDDQTPFIQHGRHVITTLEEAKESAIRFNESVS